MTDDGGTPSRGTERSQLGTLLPYGIVATHLLDFWLASEDLPLPDSRVTPRPDGSVKLAVQPDNTSEGLARLRHTFDSMLGDLGLQSKSFERNLYLHKAMDVSATAHQAGTVRFGSSDQEPPVNPPMPNPAPTRRHGRPRSGGHHRPRPRRTADRSRTEVRKTAGGRRCTPLFLGAVRR